MEPTASATATPAGLSGLTQRWPSLLLIKLGRITVHRINSALAPLTLKTPQFATLVELADRGPVPQQRLADELHLDPTNVVALLNDLEEKGLAERKRDPEDRRRHIVEISNKGRTQLAKAEKAMSAVEDELLGDLGKDERRQLAELLNEVWLRAGGMEAYLDAEVTIPPREIPAGEAKP